MGGEKANFFQPSLDPLTKITGTKDTVDKRLGKRQRKSRHHQTTNNDP